MTTLPTSPEAVFTERADPIGFPRAAEPDAEPGIADLLEALGASGEAYAVTVYRGPNQRGEFLTTYDGADFGLSRVQDDFGAGTYYAQIKRGTRTVKGGRFAIGPKPKGHNESEPRAAAPAPAPAAAPSGLDPLALIVAQMNRQHEMLMAMIRAQPAAPVAADPLAGIDRVIKLIQPKNQLSELMEALRAVREFAPESPASGGSEWAGLIQALPGLLSSLAQQAGPSIEQHPAVVQARRIVAMAEARKAAPATALPAMIAPAAPRPAPLVAGPAPAAPVAEPADVPPVDFRAAWIREAVPMLRLVLRLPDFDVDTYAQVAIDAIEARGADVDQVIGGTPGELAAMVLAEAPDLEPHAATLRKLEAAIRDAEPDDDADPMGGALDDNGRPRAGDPRQYPKPPAACPLDRCAGF